MPHHEHSHSEHEHSHSHDHEHSHSHNQEVPHAHGEHGHTHSHTHTKKVLNRLSRAIGHLTAVRSMVEDGRDCSEVLIQLAAVRSALNSTSKVILKDHLDHCIVDAIRSGDSQALDALNHAIETIIK